jgi:cell filamentation protein
MRKHASSKPLTKEERDRLEANLIFPRVVELQLDPVRGTFDAAHLREVNRRIFQDLPGAGLTDVTPGQYRPASPAGKDWYKNRGLSVAKTETFFVAYSSMDASAQTRLDTALQSADPAKLAKLTTKEFTAAIATLYVELDYLHPFSDGNSRTLRTLTGQLAREAGYHIDWERFNKSDGGRDVLYIARDLSVNELAEPHLQDQGTRVAIATSASMLAGNRTLPDLLSDAVRPLRAIAFEQLSEREALQDHPELVDAYKTLHAAAAHFKQALPTDVGAQEQATRSAKQKIVERLNEGEIRNFAQRQSGDRNPGGRDRSKDHDR